MVNLFQYFSLAASFFNMAWLRECPDFWTWKCPMIGEPKMARSPIKSRILCLTNSSLYLRPSSLSTLKPSITMALSSDPPLAKPASLNALISCKKPKVRALLISVIKSFPEKRNSYFCLFIRGWWKSTVKDILSSFDGFMNIDRLPGSWDSSWSQ